ncbi:7154_t:CDS:2 [Entrophospora sp. SA101]|nr:7154_t:CDS:2 [Entrophospora sp. SA101]
MDLDKSFLVTNDSLSRDDYVSLSQDVFDSTFQNASNVYPRDILDHSSVNTIDQTNMAELKQRRKTYASQTRSLVSKRKSISDKVFQNAVTKKFKANKNAYTPEFVSLATQMSNIGQITLARWNKEVAQVVIHDNLPNKDCRFFSYGIIADESTRGEKKIFLVCLSYWNHHTNEPLLSIIRMVDIERCSAIVVCDTIIESCQSYNICTNKCLYWLTDNTGYMSGEKGGAVVEFKKKTGSKTVRIPCGLHAIHIVVNAFEKITFGSNPNPSGLSLCPHPFNLLNLAYYLHNGYNDSDKDNPLNMKTETIKKLYWTFLQYQLKNYQKPISTRWLYQLETAKQYLDRKDIHLVFARFFVDQLMSSKNVPERYYHKWTTFLSWLQDEKMNILIRIMVQFGKWFYERLFHFLTGADPCPRVQHNGTPKTLPNGYQAHELPDMVGKWTKELNEVVERPEIIFFEEFQAAIICVVLNTPLPNFSNNLASKYIDQLVDDFNNNNQRKESFGLFEALQEDDFQSRLQLSGPKPLGCMLTSEKLKDVCAQQHRITPNPINLNFGEEATKNILKHILKNK